MDRYAALDLEMAEYVRDCAKEAEKNGILGHGLHQPLDTLFEGVYEEMPWHLREQRQQMFDEAEAARRSEEHTSELQSLLRISYAVVCMKKKKNKKKKTRD